MPMLHLGMTWPQTPLSVHETLLLSLPLCVFPSGRLANVILPQWLEMLPLDHTSIFQTISWSMRDPQCGMIAHMRLSFHLYRPASEGLETALTVNRGFKFYIDVEISISDIDSMNRLTEPDMSHTVVTNIVVICNAKRCVWNKF